MHFGKLNVQNDQINTPTKMKSGLPKSSPCAAHELLSGQELPTNFQSLYNISDHGRLRLLDYKVDSSNLNAEKVVGSGQLQHASE